MVARNMSKNLSIRIGEILRPDNFTGDVVPASEDRHKIWMKTVPPQLEIDADIDWQNIAARFELSGAGILNVVHYCAVESLANPLESLNAKWLENEILREFIKEGKVL